MKYCDVYNTICLYGGICIECPKLKKEYQRECMYMRGSVYENRHVPIFTAKRPVFGVITYERYERKQKNQKGIDEYVERK